MITYDYPLSGRYNETVATIGGARYLVDTQYAVVLPYKGATLDGIDCKALVADARINGKRGFAPRPVAPAPKHVESRAVCPKCQTYCFGDCEAK